MNPVFHFFPPRVILKAFTACLLALLPVGVLFADDPVSMTAENKDGLYNIEGSFYVKTGPDVVWDVLTGYERIPRFVGSLKKSHVEDNLGPYHFLLGQEFEGGFLFFTKKVRVLLDVHEVWYQTIAFTDIDRRDFKIYQGSWEVTPDPVRGLEITYRLKAQPNFDLPFAGDYMNGGARDLLEAVRREILRYQAKKEKEQSQAAHFAKQTVTSPIQERFPASQSN